MTLVNFGRYPGNNYPEVRFYPSMADHLLEIVAALFAASCVGMAIYFQYTSSTWSQPSEYWWTQAGVSLILSLLLGFTAYLPMKFYNFPFQLNDRNIGMQCLLATRSIRVINAVINFIFAVRMLSVIEPEIAGLTLPIGVTLLIITIAGYYLLAYRYK